MWWIILLGFISCVQSQITLIDRPFRVGVGSGNPGDTNPVLFYCSKFTTVCITLICNNMSAFGNRNPVFSINTNSAVVYSDVLYGSDNLNSDCMDCGGTFIPLVMNLATGATISKNNGSVSCTPGVQCRVSNSPMINILNFGSNTNGFLMYPSTVRNCLPQQCSNGVIITFSISLLIIILPILICIMC